MPGLMQKPPKCCNRPGKYEITYDCGPNPDQKLILCEFHYNLESVFQRNIKKIEEIK